jgi:TonB dependent receptor
VNYEIGARGQPAPTVSYSAAFFLGRVSDAIVQGPEIGGRAFFRNVGKTHNDGVELGVSVSPATGLTLRGSYTYARYRFTDYVLADGTSLNGNRFPGVPEHFWRFGLRTSLPADFFLDADHTLNSSIVADDANTIYVDSWGAIPRSKQLVGPPLCRIGHAERRRWAGIRARTAADSLHRDGDRVPHGSVTTSCILGRQYLGLDAADLHIWSAGGCNGWDESSWAQGALTKQANQPYNNEAGSRSITTRISPSRRRLRAA